ncbi:hypothetical protein F5X99DRAFT_417822 [Biscogniauxia marginata]|nr:hypothetical protein F5X99DRAFT_417822 [Biscogniauxia marginata]
MGSKTTIQIARRIDQPTGPSPSAPPTPTSTLLPSLKSWSLYHQPLTRVLMLGAHEDKPLYAVSHYTGWCEITLPILAATQRSINSGGGPYSIIVLPTLPGSALDSSQEILRIQYDWPLDTFRFTVEIGTMPDNWTRESFEWRYSYKMVASTLDRVGDGWKLVRLSTIDLAGRSQGYSKEAASDGAEIVAALKFSFLGSGTTRVLGDRWAVMAVMTALRMYQGQERHWKIL